MNVYVISAESKLRNIEGEAHGTYVQVEYAFVDEKKAKKKLKEMRDLIYADRDVDWEIHEVPICDCDSFKFAVMAGMSPAEKES
jgi:hypothetical protein